MHPERLSRPYEQLVSEIFGTPGHPPLLILSGPPGMDLDSAFDEVLAYCNNRYPSRPKIVNLSFGDPRPKFSLPELATPRSGTRAAPGNLLLLRDAQRAQPESLAALETLIRQLSGTSSLCVCGVGLPLPPHTRAAFTAALDRLSRDGLVRHVTLRPLSPRELGAFVINSLDAVLEPAALTGLWKLTRGWPAVTGGLLDDFNRRGLVHVVDRHAYLRRGVPSSNAEDPVRWIRRLGPDIWRAAKAVAVLSPLGEAMPPLLAEALETSEPQARALLVQLERAGVLKYRTADKAWWFRLPLTARCLKELLGPYERRRLARIAVTALWAGTAHSTDSRYLPDLLVDAGSIVDQERAKNDLLANAGRLALRGGHASIPWLRAVADLTTDRAERVGTLLIHARTCLLRGEATLALESSETILKSYGAEISPERLLDILFVHLTAVHQAGETGTLEKIADGDWWPWSCSPQERTVATAFALSLLGRWQETHELLKSAPADRYTADIIAHAGLWVGETDGFDRLVDTLPERFRTGENPLQEASRHAGALLVLAERDRAEQVLTGVDGAPLQLDLPGRSIAAVYEGRIDDALALAHKSIATSAPHGCDNVQTAMYQLAAVLQLFRGRLARARDLITIARARQPTLPHLLAIAEARYELVFGEIDQAKTILECALATTEANGVLARTEGLWIGLSDIALHTGQTDRLPEYLRKVDHVADRMGTELTEIDRLTLRALVRSDSAAAESAIQLAARRGQPLEKVVVVQRLVRYGMADPALLGEAYAILGEMNTLLSRASMRTLMRLHGVAIPGRQEAVAENERLLTVLVAEGLSNKQIANALGSSEKSVEGRLSRLFSRTGYQSRVALATAMLTGQLH